MQRRSKAEGSHGDAGMRHLNSNGGDPASGLVAAAWARCSRQKTLALPWMVFIWGLGWTADATYKAVVEEALSGKTADSLAANSRDA